MCVINLLGLTCVGETSFPQIAECSFLIHDVGLPEKNLALLWPQSEKDLILGKQIITEIFTFKQCLTILKFELDFLESGIWEVN